MKFCLSKGNPVVRTLEKWLSMWMSGKVHTWCCKITLTWHDDEMTQTIQTHLLNITDWRFDWPSQCLWLIIGWSRWRLGNSEYDSFVSVTNFYIVNKHVHMKKTPWVWPEHGCNHDIDINMKKWLMEWSIKVGAKSHMISQIQPECMQSSRKTLKGDSEIRCRPKFWKVLQSLQHFKTQ